MIQTITIFSILILLSYTYLSHYWANIPQTLKQPEVFKMEPGTKLKKLSRELFEKNIIANPDYFNLLVKITRKYHRFQAGTYLFEGNISPQDVMSKFLNGEVYRQVSFKFTIPEGFTARQINERLNSIGIEDFEKLENLRLSKELAEKYMIPKDNLEGFLYPATYIFYEDIPRPEEIYTRMLEEFFLRLPNNYQQAAEKLGLTLYQAVIFASLIEKETQWPEEMTLISEVIWNRLKKKIPLGIDAALIYGIKDYDGNIRRKHLKDRNNVYNTRLRKGLPPTPIASPSLESLLAVLNPDSQGNLYYVLKPASDGKHQFSKTLGEHNLHVKRLVNEYREKK